MKYLALGDSISIDDYTITIPANKHIVTKGIHKVLDWNDQWHTFFDEVPTGPLSTGEIAKWTKKAIDMAIDLLHMPTAPRRTPATPAPEVSRPGDRLPRRPTRCSGLRGV